jgi:hypothetical protein
LTTRVLTASGTELSMKIECPERVNAIASANLLLDELTDDIRLSDEPLDFEASAGLVPDQAADGSSFLADGYRGSTRSVVCRARALVIEREGAPRPYLAK